MTEDKYTLRAANLSVGGWVEQFRKLVVDSGCAWREPRIHADQGWAGWGDAEYGLVFQIFTDGETTLDLLGKEDEIWHDPTDEQLVAAWKRFTGGA